MEQYKFYSGGPHGGKSFVDKMMKEIIANNGKCQATHEAIFTVKPVRRLKKKHPMDVINAMHSGLYRQYETRRRNGQRMSLYDFIGTLPKPEIEKILARI